jgi:hypothetical protein
VDLERYEDPVTYKCGVVRPSEVKGLVTAAQSRYDRLVAGSHGLSGIGVDTSASPGNQATRKLRSMLSHHFLIVHVLKIFSLLESYILKSALTLFSTIRRDQIR